MSLKCESDGVSTWAKLDGCSILAMFVYMQKYCEGVCFFTGKLQTFEPIVHIVLSMCEVFLLWFWRNMNCLI